MRPFNSLFNHTTTTPESEKPGQLAQAEPLLAGTLALMTSYSQGCCDVHSIQMARKIIDNLSALSAHPGTSLAFQAMTANLRVLWLNVLDALHQQQAAQPAEPVHAAPAPSNPWPPQPVNASALWHTTPETVQ